MKVMMKLTNFVKSQSLLRHRTLQNLLSKLNCNHDDLLTHNNVRWLCIGICIDKVGELGEELTILLTEHGDPAKAFLDIMQSGDEMYNLVFLVDFCNILMHWILRLNHL